MIEKLKSLVGFFEKEETYVQILMEESSPTHISYLQGNLENITSNQFTAGSIRFVYKGVEASYSFNNFDFELIKKQGLSVLKSLSIIKSQGQNLEHFKGIQDFITTSCEIDPTKIHLEEKNNLLKKYYELLLQEKNEKLVSTQAVYKDNFRKIYFVNSEGSKIIQHKQFIGMSLSSTAKDGNNIQRSNFSHAMYGGMEVLKDHEKAISLLAKQSLDLLQAKPLPKGRYNVILDNRMTGVFAHEAFGHLAEADFTCDNQSMSSMMSQGQKFGVSNLNIVDDGRLESLAGYTPYDDEGIRAQKTHLVKNGCLHSLMHSRETAVKMGASPTGNARSLNAGYQPLVRMTNTYIDKGSESKESLFEKLGDGLYCCNFIGGMTNLDSFTFTPSLSYFVKDGKPTKLCSNVMLSGNVFETLKKITAIADDVKHYGTLGGCGKGGQNGLPVTIGGPHILLNDIIIG